MTSFSTRDDGVEIKQVKHIFPGRFIEITERILNDTHSEVCHCLPVRTMTPVENYFFHIAQIMSFQQYQER